MQSVQSAKVLTKIVFISSFVLVKYTSVDKSVLPMLERILLIWVSQASNPFSVKLPTLFNCSIFAGVNVAGYLFFVGREPSLEEEITVKGWSRKFNFITNNSIPNSKIHTNISQKMNSGFPIGIDFAICKVI